MRAVALKERLAALDDNERWELLHQTVMSEPHWAVRSDVVRMLSNEPRQEVWQVLFDSYEKFASPPAYRQTVQLVIGQRYVFDHEGFIQILRQRPADQRMMGLQIIADVSHARDLSALREMAASDPDEAVADMAGRIVFQMLMR